MLWSQGAAPGRSCLLFNSVYLWSEFATVLILSLAPTKRVARAAEPWWPAGPCGERAGSSVPPGCSSGTPAKRQVCCEDLPSPLLHLVLPLPSWRRRGMGSEDLDAPPTCGSARSRPAGRREMARGARSSAFASISCRWAKKYRQGRRTCKSCAVLLSWLTDFNHSFRENKIAFRDLDAVLWRGFQNPLLALS